MNHFSLSPEIFARRINIADVPGFFNKPVPIEPGIRAVIIDDGINIGEVPSGTYNFSSFTSRLKDWWNQKQCDAIVVRSEDQLLKLTSGAVLTRDLLCVQFQTQISVKLRDVMIFHQRVMGNCTDYSVQDLQNLLLPRLTDLISGYVRSLSLETLREADATGKLDAWLSDQLALTLQQYGIAFGDVRTLSILHPEYDAELKRRGETVLRQFAAETGRMDAKLADEAAWDAVRQQDRAQQVRAAAENLDLRQRDQDLANVLRRVEVRSRLRAAVQSDEFSKLETVAQREQFLRSLDREKLLAEDEFQRLQETLRQQAEDREQSRRHLLERLSVLQQLDLDMLADECQHELSRRRRQYELTLTAIDENEADRQWRRQLTNESEQAEHARVERWKAWEHRVRRFRSYWQEKRDDEVQQLLHEVERDRITGDVELQQAHRKNRLQMLEHDMRLREAQTRINEQKIADQYELRRREEQEAFEKKCREEAAELAHQQAVRAAELEQKKRQGELQEHEFRRDAQQASLRAMLEQQQLQAEQNHRRKLEWEKLQRRAKEWETQREHTRQIERQRLEQEIAENQRRDNQAHDLAMARLQNDRFLNARGQSIETLIFMAPPENADKLVVLESARQKAAAEAAAAKAQADAAIAKAQADAAIARAQSDAAAAKAHADAAAATLTSAAIGQKDQELLAAKNQHIASIEAASDKRDASTQQLVQKMLDALAPRHQPAPPVQQTQMPVPGTTVVINHAPPNTVAAVEKRCPYCHVTIPADCRFCPKCSGRLE